MKFVSSIKARVTLWYLFILALALGILSLVSYSMLSRQVSARIQTPLVTYDTQVQLENPTGSPGQDFVFLGTYTISADAVRNIQTEAQSILPLGSVFGVVPLDQKGFITPGVSGTQSVSVYGRLSQTDPDTLEVLVVLQSATQVSDVMKAFSGVLYFTTPAALLIAGLLGFFLIRRALRPIDDISRAARGIETPNLRDRIPVGGSDELGRLSLELNRMLEREHAAFKREREFTAEASHGLKTPLAVMQGEATLALRGGRSREAYEKSLVTISNDIMRLSSTIDRLLNIERMENGNILPDLQEIKLKDFLDDVAADVDVLCEEKGIHFRLDTAGTKDGVHIQGDKPRLRELFLNLADNAIKYTAAGGDIIMAAVSDSDFVQISIQDSGIGIPAQNLAHVFEKFYRAGGADTGETPGAGLGLAICRSIAVLHGGRIEAQSAPGKGSTFTLFLPLPA